MIKFENYMVALSRRSFWGPFAIIAGIVVFYFSSTMKNDNYVVLGAGAFLTLAGVMLMFRQSSYLSDSVHTEKSKDGTDADYVVRQLSRNFEILRGQTNQGFLLSGAFMAIGLLVIIGSVYAPSLGLQTQEVNSLGAVAGIVTEFISGTALVLYRLNFRRLNETSDRLDEAWRVLAAFKLTRELPENEKAQATLQLISTLTREANKRVQPTS